MLLSAGYRPDGFWTSFWLSPGFGGAAALITAAIAGVLAWRRLRTDRDDARASERQTRWWEQYAFIWDNRLTLSDERVVDMLEALRRTVEVPHQRVFLAVMTSALLEGIRNAEEW